MNAPGEQPDDKDDQSSDSQQAPAQCQPGQGARPEDHHGNHGAWIQDPVRDSLVVQVGQKQRDGHGPEPQVGGQDPGGTKKRGGRTEQGSGGGLDDGVTGYLVSATPVAMADGIARVLGAQDGGAELGAAGRAKIAAEFRWSRGAEDLLGAARGVEDTWSGAG